MRKILIQLDTDPLPSTFDRVVAIDSDVDELFSCAGITPDSVTTLVHGAIFTRGPGDLKNTAIFIGGSHAPAGEAVMKRVRSVFFGPMRVSVMMDSNGCNTTAAAAICAAARHAELPGARAMVLGGTGPVGHRAALLLARQGADVQIASRSLEKGAAVCAAIREAVPQAKVSACLSSAEPLTRALDGISLLISAGSTSIRFLGAAQWQGLPSLRVAIDLNAVPPLGLEGIEVGDKGVERGGGKIICYGAIGVGGLKMKVHKAAVRKLFDANDHVLDTAEIYAIAESLA